MGDMSALTTPSSPPFPDRSTLSLEGEMRISSLGSFGQGAVGATTEVAAASLTPTNFLPPLELPMLALPKSHVPAHSLLTEGLAQAQPLLSLSPSGPLV